jgi:cytochrome P450 family 628
LHFTNLASLQDELDPLFENDQFDPRKSYPVLDSVLNESMRLQPPTPSGLQRKTPPMGESIGDHFIPGNTNCRFPDYVAWRDSRNFAEADRFIPERWTTKKNLLIHPEVFNPLGNGAYNCVGQDLAWLQMRASLARLVVTFEWAFQDGFDVQAWEHSGKDHFTMTFDPLPLIYSKRSAEKEKN